MKNKEKLKSKILSTPDKKQLSIEMTNLIDELFNESNDLIYIKSILNEYINYIKEAIQECLREKRIYANRIKKFSHIEKGDGYLKRAFSSAMLQKLPKQIELLTFAENYLNLKMETLEDYYQQKEIQHIENSEITYLKSELSHVKQALKSSFDANKKTFTRKEACAYLSITNRKLTTLLGDQKNPLKPISYALKPYTFSREELDRYISSQE